MTTALYTGSFDPITLGHLNIATRAAKIFDQVVIAVFDKPLKRLTFSPEARLAMTQEAVAGASNISVMQYSGLTVNVAREIGAQILVRGVRFVADFDREMQLSMANHTLAPEIESVCLVASQEYAFVSASIVKEIAMNGGDASHLVPAHVATALKKQFT